MSGALDGLRIGWIGIGRMGTPLARRLLQAGARVHVFDVNKANSEALVREGAMACDSAAALLDASDIVFSMVPDDTALKQTAAALAAMNGAGKTYIDMSTVSPSGSAEAGNLLNASGLAFLRCPVSGSTATAAAGELSILCSGPKASFEQCHPVLSVLGSRLTYLGDAEQARVMKLVINLVVGITPAILGEVMAFGARLGLDRASMVDALQHSAAGSPLIGYKAKMMTERDWTAMASINLVAKDFDLALDAARSASIPLPFSA